MKNEAPKTDEDLVSRIDGEITDALGYGDTIAEQRNEAMRYYYGELFGNEVEGRSQYVDRTVQDVIEWIKPSLMRVFASGDELVQFVPKKQEDVAMAEQATDYVNYVVRQDNDGWSIFYSWFTDALLQKNGIVKAWWNEYEEVEREEYKNLTDIELEQVVQNDEVTIIEHESYEGPMPDIQPQPPQGMPPQGPQMPGMPPQQGMPPQGTPPQPGIPQEPPMMHDVVVHRTSTNGRIVIDNVPPGEFLINREAKSIEDARFTCHRVRKTLSELREMYPDEELGPEDLTGGGIETNIWDSGNSARHSFDNSGYEFPWGDNSQEESLSEYWLFESFMKTDWDGDGIAELRKICSVGDKILANDAVDNVPFISITPVKIPHKFFGMSIADLVMDLQRIKSTLMRNLLDNAYNQNFGRYAVLEGQANLDDLLTARPGGIVRVKSPNAVMPLATPALEPYTFQMLEYIDGIRESRAGVSKNSQGMNDKALTSHTTATAVNAVMTAAQSRIELVARQFAETGVKDLMNRVYELLVKNQDRERTIKLRNEWVPVDPTNWDASMDSVVSVALGHGNKDQQVAQLTHVLQMAGQAQAKGDPMITGDNIYNISASLLKAMGMQNVDDYLTPPNMQPPKQPPQPSPKEQAEIAKMQADTQKSQSETQRMSMDSQIDQAKFQLDTEEFQHKKGIDLADLELKQAELQVELEQDRPVKVG